MWELNGSVCRAPSIEFDTSKCFLNMHYYYFPTLLPSKAIIGDAYQVQWAPGLQWELCIQNPTFIFWILIFLLKSQGDMFFPISMATQASWWTVTEWGQSHKWAKQQAGLETLEQLESGEKPHAGTGTPPLRARQLFDSMVGKNFEKWAGPLCCSKQLLAVRWESVLQLKTSKKKKKSIPISVHVITWSIHCAAVVSRRWHFRKQSSCPTPPGGTGPKPRTCREVAGPELPLCHVCANCGRGTNYHLFLSEVLVHKMSSGHLSLNLSKTNIPPTPSFSCSGAHSKDWRYAHTKP